MKLGTIALAVIVVCSALALASLESATALPSIDLSLYKDNGYGVGNDMNGKWTLNAEVSSDVTIVEFYLDGQLVSNDTSAPFSWSFDTADYSNGLHLFRGVAYADGELNYQEIPKNFVPFPLDFVVGIIALIIITLVVALIGGLIKSKKIGKKPKNNAD